MNKELTYKIISRHKWMGETKWTEWTECEATEGLTIAECEMLLMEWARDKEGKVGHYGNLYRVQDELITEEFKIVDDRLCVMTHNKILSGKYFA